MDPNRRKSSEGARPSIFATFHLGSPSFYTLPPDRTCPTPPTFVAFLIRPARAPVHPRSEPRRLTSASASTRRRPPPLCRAVSPLLRLSSLPADPSLSAKSRRRLRLRLRSTGQVSLSLLFLFPFSFPFSSFLLRRSAASLHCSAAEALSRRNPTPIRPVHQPIRTVQPLCQQPEKVTSLYGPHKLSYGPYTTSDRAMDPDQERRTKHASAKRPRSTPPRRNPPPPPPPAPEPYDSGSDQTLSGEYTDSATPFEERYFTMPTRRMYDNFIKLQKKTVENTQMVDLETLRKLGVEEDFLHLTSRVGFCPIFWQHEHNCYEMDTREFLSSLQLKRDENDLRFIKFRLCNTTHRVYFNALRSWFGFLHDTTTDTLSFREGWDRDIFWEQITGKSKAPNDEYRARFISHPVLRIIQRALACTIFARGETLNRGNQIDLMLMDNMLRPDPDIPDLALLMVQHWLDLQKSKRSGSKIKIGLFVQIIKTGLGLADFPGRGLCSGPTSLNPESLQLQHFIKIHRGPAGHSDLYDWRFANDTTRRLPFAAPIDLEDHSTWLIDNPLPPPPPPRHARATPSSSTQPATDIPSSSTATAPQGTYPADPTLRDLYSLMTDIRDTQQEQGAHILEIQRQTFLHTERLDQLSGHMSDYAARLGDIEDQFRDWRFDPSSDY